MTDTGVTPYGPSTGSAAGGPSSDVHQPLWDTSEFDQNVTSFLFFQLQQGQALPISGTRKNKTHTNMTLAGQLPAGLAFKVQSLRVWLNEAFSGAGAANSPDAMQQVLRVFQGSLLEFKLLDKIIYSVPLITCNPGAGVDWYAPEAVSSVIHGQLGSRETGAIMPLQTPIIIDSNQNFQVEVTLPAALGTGITAAHQIVCMLDGMTFKPTQ